MKRYFIELKKNWGYEGPISRYESAEGFPFSSLNFNSMSIRKEIEKYGIINNKTFKLKSLPHNLPEEFLIDYIRGYFDGDGCICETKENKVFMSFVSANKEFLEDLALFLYKTYGVAVPKIHPDHNAFSITYYKKKYFIFRKFIL